MPTRKFRWQINASAVGSLLGYFGEERRHKALAECWLMNTKRMPRFGAIPSEVPSQKTKEQIVQQELDKKPEYKTHIQKGIEDSTQQQKMVSQMKKTASDLLETAKRKHESITKSMQKINQTKIIPKYTSKKSGTKRAAIGSFFMVHDKIYHKTSRKTAKLTDIETAAQHGYQTKQEITLRQKQKEIEIQKSSTSIKRAKIVQENIVKQATKTINTTRGTIRESTDLELVQTRFPNCLPGNDKAYFMHISATKGYSGFVIGKIDGHSPDMIFELKHRQSRLFGTLRDYEQVQVILYMKMTNCLHAMLVETYQGKQNYFELKLNDIGQCHFRPENKAWIRGLDFIHVKNKLEQVIEQLNMAETNSSFRNDLKKYIF